MQNRLKPTVPLSSLISPHFHPVHKDIKSNLYNEVWLKGGRASTKSSFIAIEIVWGIVDDPDANAIVFRKVSDTIRTSVHALFLWAIRKSQLTDYFDWTTSPAEITYKPTGQKIFFKGLDKPEKLKSIALPNGYFRYSWFEELAEYSNAEEIRNVLQSIARGTDKHITFYSYNPPDDEYSWVNKESVVNVPTRITHHSTYLDVPTEWLGAKFIADAEKLKAHDYDRYRHEYLGEIVGRTEKLVMAGRWRVANENEIEKYSKLEEVYFGADFGYARDPNVLCKLRVDFENMIVFVEHAQYGQRTETDDLPELFSQVPEARGHVIRADSARPETISYLRRHGFEKIQGVKKWPGSVEEGVNYMKNFKWVFHPRCTKAIDEAKNWAWKTNKAGDILAKLEEGYDHFWDAARYALTPLIRKRDGESIVIASTTGGHIAELGNGEVIVI